jgi:pentatricopeptide repeat protein
MPDIIIYSTSINGFCKIGHADGALKLFKELQIKGHFPDEFTYCTLVIGLWRAHREEDANKLLEHLAQKEFKPIVSIYYQFMKILGRKRKVMQAVKLWLDYLAKSAPKLK